MQCILANVLGIHSIDLRASAIAQFRVREIPLVLDLSASMSYDSQLRHIDRLGRTEVEQALRTIWEDLGSPTYGNMQFTPVYIASGNDNVVMATLGLNGVPYPYPSGSWIAYLRYVQTDSTVNSAGYHKRYGYLTLVNYLQDEEYKATATPTLWRTHEQPMTAVKDAVAVFLDYMRQEQTDDRVALVSYTYTDGEGILEVPLTEDYDLIETTARQRQAGHYHNQTNIAGGLHAARNELLTRGRIGALRLIVLLSDGQTNWYHNRVDPTNARRAALDEANRAANDHLPIVTISLGADADVNLMEQIADITSGIHFVVPGGDDVADYANALVKVFMQIAAYRPLKLVD